jgi:peptide/nickel transport system ATP-binding protein/oligopeptide transport system ATP-binding protein
VNGNDITGPASTGSGATGGSAPDGPQSFLKDATPAAPAAVVSSERPAPAPAVVSAPPAGDALVTVTDLQVHFPVTRGGLIPRKVGAVRAVDGLNFGLRRGETLGLVGESGSGKTTAGRAIVRLLEPTGGKVEFDGRDITHLSAGKMRPLRREIQMIFQDPYTSLNPRHTVGSIVSAPLKIIGELSGDEVKARVRELMELVGLSPEHLNRYPHEFSGGQRQRIGIARALATGPKLVIADEPVSALDVSVRAQVVNLLSDLQSELGLTYLFIAHDLSVVRHISDRVAVMYLGTIVEMADRTGMYEHPLHPYTHALLSAVPVPDPVKQHRRERILLRGDPPTPLNPPSGCRFHPRCWKAEEVCKTVEPELVEIQPGHLAACHFPEERELV